MKYKIVLVPFPFDDLSASKVRPAICLTEKISIYNHVVIAFITSQVQNATEQSDIVLSQTDADFQQTGLSVSSAIRLHRLVTIPTSLIRRALGELPSTYHQELADKLRQLFKI
ncbi:MAG: type II toxin-antitoxin system PemK/MazF family toxin [Saprospiraceae bacterium]